MTAKARQSQAAVKPAKVGAVRQSAPVGGFETIVDQEDEHIGGGFESVQEIHDALPSFLKPENIMDKHKRRPDHDEYDDTTLFIPPGEWKNITPAMQQYWQLKQDNFEKVFFFKLGKFYEPQSSAKSCWTSTGWAGAKSCTSGSRRRLWTSTCRL